MIYRVPRRFPGLARVVNTRVAEQLQSPRSNSDVEYVGAYADAMESGPDSPAIAHWISTDKMRIRARLSSGESVLVQVSYDPSWRAYAAGKRLAIQKDAFGFMRIGAPPGENDIRLTFELPLENLLGRIVSVLTACLVIVVLGTRTAPSPFEEFY